MSHKFTLTAVLAIAVFLIAAAVVYGQGNIQGNTTPRGTMQVPYTATTPSAPATTPTPGGGTTTPGGPGYMMGNGNGAGMMSDENYQAMRDAMQSGNWEQMQNTCQNAINSAQTQQAPQTQQTPQTSNRSTGSMMGRGSRSV